MKLGIVLNKIPKTNIFIVDVGWGQLRYFTSNNFYKEGDFVLYNEHFILDVEEEDILYETRKSWLKEEPTITNSNRDRITDICNFNSCEFLGNVRFDFHNPQFPKSKIVIARKDSFIYWEGYGAENHFELVSNTLLFKSYAEPRYPYPDEMEWLKAYSYARKKVDELDIPRMIDELKVEFQNHSWTRRGSDNVTFSNSRVRYCYEYHYSYLHDHYLDAFFPKYDESLYSSRDGECEYIHPKFEKMEIIRNPDGSIEIKEPKFDGMNIEDYCNKKTKELRQLALINYESYNRDEHINYIAYHHINWHCINEENELFQRMKVLAEIIWGFNHQKLLKQITRDNYKELIRCNNRNHPIPRLP